jgi:hypothetical protein
LAAGLLASVLTTSVLGGAAGAASPALGDLNLDEMRQQVAQVRGLPTAPAPIVTLDRAAIIARLSQPINAPQSVREFLTSQMLLEVLGAMPEGFDLRQLQLDVLNEQLLALYDHGDHSIYLVADATTGPTERLTLVHELSHALQDQSFDLGRMLPEQPENSDVGMAAQALVEGDAMVTMRVWGRQYLLPDEKRSLGDDTTPSDPVLDAAPTFVRGELTFPYDAGWIFAQLLYQDGGFDAINQAFADPPRSTEQILHPEKYAAHEAPIVVTLPALERVLPGSWTTRRTDVFGELALRLLLEPRVGWPVAESAAAGWGGDAYTILEDDSGRRIVGFVTVWDSKQDAAEFYNAYTSAVTDQYQSSLAPLINDPSLLRWAVPGAQLQVLETGATVRFVYAPDAATLEAVDAQLSNASVSASTTAPVSPGRAVPPPSQTPTPALPATPGDTMPAGDGPAVPAFAPPGPVSPPTTSATTTTVAPTATPPTSDDNSD